MHQLNKPWYSDLIIAISLIACIAGYFGLLNYYSFDISSDDALYFQRALNHFSVLEFSPHFPGYPGFVWLERLVYSISQHPNSNVLVSYLSAIALTFSVFVYCYQRMHTKSFALFAVLLFLLQGNIVELAFNGLSDASALWFFSLYLLCTRFDPPRLQRPTFTATFTTTCTAIISGLLLAACLATRPSYLPLVASAMLLALCYQDKTQSSYKQLGWQMISITFIGFICALYVFMQDGWAYLEEGQRFTQGHFAIWGNTTSTTDSLLNQWLTTLTNTYSTFGLILLTSTLAIGLYITKTRGLSILACCWLAWIIRGQNPENIRHLAVFSLLLPMISAQLLEHAYQKKVQNQGYSPALTLFSTMLLSIVLVVTLGNHSLKQFMPQLNAPVLQASQFFNNIDEQQIIISNYNIDNLRHNLPQHVVLDRHYQNSSNYQAQQQGYWRLSSNKLSPNELVNADLVAQFKGRFLGDRSLYLYYFDPSHLSAQT